VRDSVDKLITEKFYRLTFLNIVSNITIPLTGMVDTAILGNYAGSLFIAGVSLGTILFDYLYWGCSFLRMGTTGPTAIRMGQGDWVGLYLVLFRSLGIGFLIGSLIFVSSSWIADLVFPLLAGSEEIKAIARKYFDWRIWDAPFTMMNFVFVGWFLGNARSDLVLILTLVSNLLNIGLNYYLMSELQMTADGVALASGLSQVVQFILSAYFAFALFRKQVLPEGLDFLDQVRKGLKKVSEFFAILKFNRDVFLRSIFLIFTFSLFRNLSAYMGDEILTVNAILLQFMLIFTFFVDGAAFATEAIAGGLFGKGDFKNLKKIVKIGIIFALSITVVFILNLYFFPEFYLRIITSDPSTIQIALDTMPCLFLVLIPGSIAFIFDGLFLGLVRGRTLRNAMLLSTFVFFLPIAIFSVYLEWNGMLWLALSSFMSGRAISLGYSWRKVVGRVVD